SRTTCLISTNGRCDSNWPRRTAPGTLQSARADGSAGEWHAFRDVLLDLMKDFVEREVPECRCCRERLGTLPRRRRGRFVLGDDMIKQKEDVGLGNFSFGALIWLLRQC